MGIVKGFLKQSVEWEAVSGEDDYSAPTFASAETIRARVDEQSRVVAGSAGFERIQETRVMVGPENDIREGDRISGEVGGRAFSGYVQSRTAITLVNGQLDGYTLYL